MPTPETHLRLVDRGCTEESDVSRLGPARGNPEVPRPPQRRTAAGRPWDELAAFWLPQCAAVEGLAVAAVTRGIEFGLAVAATIERSLAASEIARISTSVVPELDELACRTQVAGAYRGAAVVYLRQLEGGASVARGSALGPVTVPGRLAVRLQPFDEDGVAALLDGDLDIALAWERAAVLEGRTITEWAMVRALSLVRV